MIAITLVSVDPMTFDLKGNRSYIIGCDKEKSSILILTEQQKIIEQSFTEMNKSKGRLWFGHYSDEEIRTAKEIL
jgi:hypothetical protein